MSRSTPDERFAAAVGDELERRVRSVTRRTRPQTGRPAWIGAAAVIVVLLVVSAATAGFVALRSSTVGGSVGPGCEHSTEVTVLLFCQPFESTGASENGRALDWSGAPPIRIDFTGQRDASLSVGIARCTWLAGPVTLIGGAIDTSRLSDFQVRCGSAAAGEQAWLDRFFSRTVRWLYDFDTHGPRPVLHLRSGSSELLLEPVPPSATPSTACADGGTPLGASFGCGAWRITTATDADRELGWSRSPQPDIEFRLASASLPEEYPGCALFSVPVTSSPSELMPGRSLAQRIDCPVSSRGAARWLDSFFAAEPHWRFEGGALVLTAGSRTLMLRPASSVSSPPTSTAGCPATTAGIPAGARTAAIPDVDGDGRPDREWARMLPDSGDLQFGIATPSGAVAAASASFAGGAARTLQAARLGDGTTVLIASERRGGVVFAVTGCRIVPITVPAWNHQLWVGFQNPSRPGSGLGLSVDRGGLVEVDAVDGSTVTERRISLFSDSRTATIGPVIDAPLGDRTEAGIRASRCGTEPVLTFE